MHKYQAANYASDCLAPSRTVPRKVDTVKKVNYSATNWECDNIFLCPLSGATRLLAKQPAVYDTHTQGRKDLSSNIKHLAFKLTVRLADGCLE